MLFIYLFIYLTQITQVHTDRNTDKQGQTQTVKETPQKAIWSKLYDSAGMKLKGLQSDGSKRTKIHRFRR